MTLRRTLGLLLLGAGLAALIGLGVVLVVFQSSFTIRHGAVLTVDLSGEIPEEARPTVFGRLFSGETRTFADVTDLFVQAASDDRVAGIVARIGPTDLGWARLQELRDVMSDFVDSGKVLACHADVLTTQEYYLASACGTIDLQPAGLFSVPGLVAQVEFYKGTLAKLGIEADMEHVGAFKSASETLTRQEMSDPAREQLDAILDAIYAEVVSAVAESRGVDEETLRDLFDRGIISPEQAKQAGLLDDLRYYDEVLQDVKDNIPGPAHELDEAVYLRDTRARRRQGSVRIAVVFATGTIVSGDSQESGILGRMIGSDTLVSALAEARKDRSVKAVVLRIDSPGGSGSAADAIWRETQRLRAEKPVVVSMGDLAASGGYWIAAGADSIVAEPLTLTGSIGVVGGKFYLKPFYDWVGVTKQILKRGRNADIYTDYARFTDEQRSLVRASMAAVYKQFLERTSAGRGKTEAEIDRLGQGRVWTGALALDKGLVDESGGLSTAIAVARDLAKIPENATVGVEVFPRPRGFFESLSDLQGDLVQGAGGFDAGRESRLLDRLVRERALALMPYRLDIR